MSNSINNLRLAEAADLAPQDRLAFDSLRIARAKAAYTLRRVDRSAMQRLVSENVVPSAGDVLLARVETLGQHSGLQLPSGRRATLFVGDEILVAYGNRYAPDQFEAVVPADLSPCDLVAGGGIAARMLGSHKRMRAPTRIRPLGLVADASGRVLNLERFGLPLASAQHRRAEAIPVIGVIGTSMNAGKTTTAANLIRGLHMAGVRVGAGKLTGTGSSGDTTLMADAGASPVLDFTDAGLATTYLAEISSVIDAAERVLSQLAADDVDAIVVEIADGLFQRETAALLTNERFVSRFSGFVFASPDSMGAVAGVEWLEQRGLPVLALAGAITMSPLAVREAVAHTRLKVLGLQQLQDPAHATELLDAGRRRLWSAGGSYAAPWQAMRV